VTYFATRCCSDPVRLFEWRVDFLWGSENDSLVVMAKPLLMRSCLFCSLPNLFHLADVVSLVAFGLFEECSG